MWPNRRFLDIVDIDLPIIQAPMAGSVTSEMVIAVSEAGGLGSLPCAMLTPDQMRAELGVIRQRTSRPLNLNFFCHRQPAPDPSRESAWKQRLSAYYRELGLDPKTPVAAVNRAPFDEAACEVVEEFKPQVVSFHFGLPVSHLLERVRATKATVISSATTVDEARWLQEHGCDAIVAQGYEAGGHRGLFLSDDITSQAGTLALVPQIVDAVTVPVIAAGGIGDGRGVVAALALGAAAVQVGTAFLFCPEAKVSCMHRAALRAARDNGTVLTNVFTGRPARGLANRVVREVGPVSDLAPAFPLAASAMAPLRAKAEASGSGDFSPLWSGQAAGLGREMSAAALTAWLMADAAARLQDLATQVPAVRDQ
ncbi:nitronate monooxygenase [Alsobacter sp. KACC 23698]|uniref:Nitronate monooxygenase n=1 Tax=Alsobacter sp. KACC 23698 TaxID=3149229 RepID=A0AAU7JP22_9HYPH